MISPCSHCCGEKHHRIIHRFNEKRTEWASYASNPQDGFDVLCVDDSYFLECQGCGTKSLRLESWNDLTEKDEVRFFPPYANRRRPHWMETDDFTKACPKAAQALLDEAYICHANGCNRSVAMAVRAILETVMVEKVGDRGSFRKNVDAFVAAGYLSAKQREVVDSVIEAGSAAIHRSFKPGDEELGIILDIAEAVLGTVYYQDVKAAALKAAVPKRKSPP